MIGGEAVPYGKLWRTGANEPTILYARDAHHRRRHSGARAVLAVHRAR